MTPRRPKQEQETATLQIGLKTSENPDEIEGSQEQDEVEAALAVLPQGTLGKLYRVEQNGEMAWLENGQPAALNEERAARHGPGKYRVIFNGPNPKKGGRVTYLGSATFVVGESAAAKALAEAKATEQPNASSPNGSMSLMDQMASSMFLNMMRQQQEAQAMQSRQQMEHSAAMMALMQKLAERPAMDPILAALLPKLFEKTDPIEQATRIAEINAKGAAKSDIANVLSVMELVERIKGDAPNGGQGDASWMGMLKDALPLLLSRQSPAPGPVAVQAPPPPNATLPAPSQPMPNNRPTVELYLQPLAPFFPRIEEAATAGMEPEVAADYFLGLIPPGHWPGLEGILDRDSVVPDIVKGYPGLAPFQAWLDGLRSALLGGIRGDGDGDEGDEDDEPQRGSKAPK
jgi:hypothetical protein